jgi:hypothetical protein
VRSTPPNERLLQPAGTTPISPASPIKAGIAMPDNHTLITIVLVLIIILVALSILSRLR